MSSRELTAERLSRAVEGECEWPTGTENGRNVNSQCPSPYRPLDEIRDLVAVNVSVRGETWAFSLDGVYAIAYSERANALGRGISDTPRGPLSRWPNGGGTSAAARRGNRAAP